MRSRLVVFAAAAAAIVSTIPVLAHAQNTSQAAPSAQTMRLDPLPNTAPTGQTYTIKPGYIEYQVQDKTPSSASIDKTLDCGGDLDLKGRPKPTSYFNYMETETNGGKLFFNLKLFEVGGDLVVVKDSYSPYSRPDQFIVVDVAVIDAAHKIVSSSQECTIPAKLDGQVPEFSNCGDIQSFISYPEVRDTVSTLTNACKTIWNGPNGLAFRQSITSDPQGKQARSNFYDRLKRIVTKLKTQNLETL